MIVVNYKKILIGLKVYSSESLNKLINKNNVEYVFLALTIYW